MLRDITVPIHDPVFTKLTEHNRPWITFVNDRFFIIAWVFFLVIFWFLLYVSGSLYFMQNANRIECFYLFGQVLVTLYQLVQQRYKFSASLIRALHECISTHDILSHANIITKIGCLPFFVVRSQCWVLIVKTFIEFDSFDFRRLISLAVFMVYFIMIWIVD